MLGETPAYKTSLLSWAIAALLVVVAASGTALVLNNTNGMLSASGNDSGTDPVESDSTLSQDSVEDETTPTTGEEEEASTSLTVSDVSFAFESLNFSGSEDFSFTLEDEEGTVYEIAGDQATQEVTVTATSDDGTVETERMGMEEFMIMMEEEEDPCAEEDEDDWSDEDEDDWSDEDEDEGSDEDDWSDEDEDEGADEDEEDWSDEDEDEGADEDEEVLSITMNFETEEVTITYVDENGDEQTETMGLEEFMAEMEDEDDPCADEDEENWFDEDEDEGSDEDEDDWSDEDEDEGSGQDEEVLSITMNFETEEVTITYVDENGDEQTETVDADDFHSILEEWFEEDEESEDKEDEAARDNESADSEDER